jgi:hypothetical protein
MTFSDLIERAAVRHLVLLVAVLASVCLVSAPLADAAPRKCGKHAKKRSKRCKPPARCRGGQAKAGKRGDRAKRATRRSRTRRRASCRRRSSPGAAAPVRGGGPRQPQAEQPGTLPGTPAATPAPTPASSPSTRLFSPGSVWNAPLAADAPLDPSSQARSAAFVAQVRSEVRAGNGPWISERAYSTPLYTVGADQPLVQVKLDAGPWAATLHSALGQGVPIPAGARPAPGTDGHLTIHQPATDTLWEFWRASRQSDGWHASWGGVMRRVSTSPGHYSNASWNGLPRSDGWNWGSTASSLPVIAGTVTIDELRRGRIDHALALAVPTPCARSFSWPAQRTDGTSNAPDCMPEGAHLRLDPSLDLAKLELPPITRMLAEAAQRYGMIVRDRTGEGNATSFFAEDPAPTGTDPYNGPGGFYGGLRPWKFLPQFPWESVRLLDMSVCTSAPCSR